ncbi:alpha/beta hydrolase fold domain-containing protein [Pacificoceanicola onchidii]|uniref:alpha/beta hydrolase fold domain-containing protein n=1 Tax=Pacificoceanicola onchidii TaxID=2562685 RepID=UPI0010A5C14D|nr:alpha/beta hydrolase fold domain-containing protein [Pacificoceanicola onchidii]
MHADFRKLAAFRRMFMKGNPQDAPDYGRAAAATWAARSAPALPDTVRVEHARYGRRLIPAQFGADPIVYIHGGGLVYYDTEVFTPFLAQIAAQTGRTVLALDYPKAPETKAPLIRAHLEATLRQITARHPRITLMGDSVGGLLAAQLAHMPGVTDLHMLYPVTDLATDPADPYGTGHFLDTSMMDWFYTFITPLGAAPLTLPRTSVHIAEADILAPQARAFALKSNAKVTEHPGLPHDFCLFSGASNAAATAVSQIADFLKVKAYA